MEGRDYGLTEDQIGMRRLCRKFVDELVIPFVKENHEREWCAPPDERWPKELMFEADKVGLRTLGVPEKYGGMSIDSMTMAIIIEELGRGDPGFTNTLAQGIKLSSLLGLIAPEHLQDKWFPEYMNDPTFLMANCMTEPQGTSDRQLPYNVPEANLRTRATFEDGSWILNGRKQFISNGYNARLYVIYATTNPDVGITDGLSCFLVPRDTPGFTIGRVNEKMGRRYCINSEFNFDNCRLPGDHLLIRDDAYQKIKTYVVAGKIFEAAQALGVAQGAFDETVNFVQEHVQGGRRIIQHQIVAGRLANMATRLEAIRAFLYYTSRALDSGASDAGKLMLMLKLFCVEEAFEVCKDAVELHGGFGVMREMGIEKFFRDAATALHTDGTTDIHRLKIINAMFPDTVGAYAGPV